MYLIIRGKFLIFRPGLGPYVPDGDTLRFQPDDPALLEQLTMRGTSPNSPVSVRFEGIDALEKDQSRSQSPNFAEVSRDRVFELLGLGQLDLRVSDFRVLFAELGEVEGFLLAHSLDKYGRVIAFVFAGHPEQADGVRLTPTAAQLARSVNFRLLSEGLVYPTFYSTLPPALRQTLAAAAMTARVERRGLWAQAVGTVDVAARVGSVQELRAQTIFPTLHRRLDDYLQEQSGLSGLVSWIRADPERRNKAVLLLPGLEQTDLAGLLAVEDETLRLREHPEEFLFIDELPRPDDLPKSAIEPGDVRLVAALIDPAGVDAGQESVTLLNTTSEPIDLALFRLQDDEGEEALAGIIRPGEALRLLVSLRLGNRGDQLRLIAGEILVDQAGWRSLDVVRGRTLVFGA